VSANGTRVLSRVAADLANSPTACSTHVLLLFLDSAADKHGNATFDNNSEREGLGESSDETKGHDTGEACGAALSLSVLDESRVATCVDDELAQLSALLADLADACSGVASDDGVLITDAEKDLGHHVSLDDDLGQLDGMLGDLGKAAADLALDLDVGVLDEAAEVGDRAVIDDDLSEFRGMLADLG
jgi:hypothetical protein